MYLGIFSINDTIRFRANTVNKQGSALDATVGPIFEVYLAGETTTIATGAMTKVAAKTGFYQGSFSAGAGYDVGQYSILIEATVDGETPSANVMFQLVSDEQSLEETFDEIQLIGDSIPIIGAGSVSIDHNFGGTDNYRVTAGGTPLAAVDIRAFVKTDYDAGRKANRFIVGQTVTTTDGRWGNVIRLDPGTYTLEFSKKGSYRTTTVTVTVKGTGIMGIESMGVETMGAAFVSMTSLETQSFAASQSISATDVTSVDHNYTGKDKFRLMHKGKPVEGVTIKIYKKSNYNTGNHGEKYIVQRTVSQGDGRWAKPLSLKRGKYVIEFSKKGLFEASTTTIKV